jgi:MFS family permease
MVLLLIGIPGFLWALLILLIKEPPRRLAVESFASTAGTRGTLWRIVPVYFVVATASLVDNAVGAWAPTLLIRGFGLDPAQVGLQLGLLLTIGFGGGVLAGGALSDWVGRDGRWLRKLAVCLVASLLILPVAGAIDAQRLTLVMTAVPLYFALSGIVTACGFSSILDAVPNRQRGFAMALSFFLNVAFGAGLGPTSVALAAQHVFGTHAGLGPPLAFTAAAGYLLAAMVLALTIAVLSRGPKRAPPQTT